MRLPFLNKKIVLNALFFLSLALTHLLLDIFIPVWMNTESASEWAVFRAILLALCPLFLFGEDQNIVRTNQIPHGIWKKLLLASILLFLALYAFSKNTGIVFLIQFICVAVFPIILLMSSYYRRNSSFYLAQFYQNGWKAILLFICIFLWVLKIESSDYLYYFLCIWLVGLLVFFKQRRIRTDKKNRTKTENYSTTFWFFSLTLTFSSYFDQFLLSKLLSNYEYVQFFSHVILFGSPWMLLCNGVAFFLSPMLAKQPKNFVVDVYQDYKNRLIILLLFLSVTYYYIAAYILYENLYGQKYYLDPKLAMMITCIFILRVYYTVLSSIIGMTFNLREIRQFLYYCLSGVFLNVLLFLLLYYVLNQQVITSLMSATFVNWLLRIYGAEQQIKGEARA